MMDGLENEAVKVTFKFTIDEMIKAHRQYLVVRKTVGKYDNIFVVALAVFSLMVIWINSLNFLTLAPLAFVFIFIISKDILYYRYPEYRMKKDASDFLQEIDACFLLDGIFMEASKLESKMEWSYFTVIYESSDFFFFERQKREYFGIPKRAFEDLEQMQVFREMAAANSIHIKF